MKDISFFNVSGCSVGVIYHDTFVAHISEPFPNEPFEFEWNMPNIKKIKFPIDQYPEAEIMAYFKTEHDRVEKETNEKIEGGWTQWVNMDYDEERMRKLEEQLDQFGLKVTLAKTEGTDFEWFKVERKYSLTAAK